MFPKKSSPSIDYLEHFTPGEIQRGLHYAKTGKVRSYASEQHPENPSWILIHAKVQGKRPQAYTVSISIDEDNDPDGACSCPVKFNCKHVLAVLLCWHRDNPSLSLPSTEKAPNINLDARLDTEKKMWISSVQHAHSIETPSYLVRYVLNYPESDYYDHNALNVTSYLLRELKKGGLGKAKSFRADHSQNQTKITETDLTICSLLAMIDDGYSYTGEHSISKYANSSFLKQLVSTGRCYWQNMMSDALTLIKEPLQAKLAWTMDNTGTQRITCTDKEGKPFEHLILLTPLWVINTNNQTIRPLEIALPEAIVTRLLKAPELPPDQVRAFATHISHHFPEDLNIPMPLTFDSVETREEEPILSVSIKKRGSKKRPTMETCVTLHYGDSALSDDDWETKTLIRAEGKTLIQVTRNIEKERESVNQIHAQINDKKIDLKSPENDLFQTNEYNSINDMVHFGETVVPQLKEMGLNVDFNSNEFYDLVNLDEWYTDLDEDSEQDWFSLDMGVMVNDKKISLLPYLLEAIKHLKLADNEEHYYLNLDSGHVLPIPTERLRKITDIITQFIDPKRLSNPDATLRISRYKASLLADISKALHHSEMRWLGGTRLLELGKRLRSFKQIKRTTPPKESFHAELRQYQQEGVNWLQFLREYELNGILADDMGLGKTIQTLAHILIEKQKNRLSQPCLIIAPTSVIYNWKSEAKRFTPSLKVLILRGTERKNDFDKIPEHDIVLTTYPLTVRDKDVLLSHKYHLLILDEAQMIKNSQAKMTQIIQQFTAKHRLCLTGTPLENHLGELWSLFHFLMPGLLGSPAEFKKNYRTPIEKHQDTDKLSSLIALIKPFMLRRTKKEVASDLPKKTEIIKRVSFDSQQRDLYESIRLSMHKKVREAIDEKGIERCQIIILDALLKLRQVCCDPQLVKLKAAEKVTQSAKLDMLLSMLDEMVPEGRRILIFSQFTSMLSLIEKALNEQGIDYVKLTGSTKDRTTPIELFQTGKIPVFLISLKSGGTGINLTAADTVIHYDPWWNPAVESQATDRSHRIGQKNPVFVYKLVTENTVEEKIIAMQEKKKSLMESLFTGNSNKASLNKKDLEFLLAD